MKCQWRGHRTDGFTAGHQERRMLPQGVEEQVELLPQTQRIQGLLDGGETVRRFRREDTARQHALIGCLGGIVPSPHPAALALLLLPLHRRLKAVNREAPRAIDCRALPIGRLALESIVADQLADDRAMLLFDGTVVVLPLGPTARAGDPLALTVREDRFVQERAPIVGSKPQQGERQALSSPREGLDDGVLAAMHEREVCRPARGDVGEHEGIEEGPFGALPTAGDAIGFHEPGPALRPCGEGTDRHVALDQCARLGRTHPTPLARTRRPQQAIGGRRTQRQQGGTHGIGEVAVAMAFACGDQLREGGHEALPADPMRGQPGDASGLPHRGTRAPWSRAADRRDHWWCRSGQQADRILAGRAGRRDKFVEDDPLLLVGRFLIPGHQLRQEFAFALEAHP